MEDSAFSSLTGFWTGVYDYPGDQLNAVPFNALIVDISGSLSGEIDEPNTIISGSVNLLYAKLSGLRDAQSVRFIKTYEQISIGHKVRYEGTANSELTKIEGQWVTIEDKYSWSGPFIMNRSGLKKGEKREIEKSEDIFERQN